ncbi:hypothetical protein [Acinetobacter sp.]|jgi:hypothetical protein|uniref:hypothetical protein n=1 Tax=Acinetobacter sp. TaxID=472 RepID=UPI0035AF2F15
MVKKFHILPKDQSPLKMRLMKNYTIQLENDFHEYAWEIEAKGWLQVDVEINQHMYTFNFYDPARLNQNIQDDLNSCQYFCDINLVVIPSVTLKHIQYFLENIIDTPSLSLYFKNQ